MDSVIDYGIIDPEAPAPIIQARLERATDAQIKAALETITDAKKRGRVRSHLVVVRRVRSWKK